MIACCQHEHKHEDNVAEIIARLSYCELLVLAVVIDELPAKREMREREVVVQGCWRYWGCRLGEHPQ